MSGERMKIFMIFFSCILKRGEHFMSFYAFFKKQEMMQRWHFRGFNFRIFTKLRSHSHGNFVCMQAVT